MRNRVIVAGHACIDITPVFPQDIKKADRISDVLQPGKLINMKGVDINPGGVVSNTGLCMKILGADVSLAAKIGNDAFGDMITEIYKQYDAAEGIIRVEGERTSYSAVISVPGFDRIFLHDPGANNTFTSEDVKRLDFTDVSLFHFGYPPIMQKMYENDGDELVEIFKYVKSLNVVTSLDMTMVDEKSEAGKCDWQKILKSVLPYVDIFVPSIEETCFMLDKARFNEWQQREGADDICLRITEDDIKPVADSLMDMGVKILLLKCGAKGLYYRTKAAEALSGIVQDERINDFASKEGFEVSFKPERVLSGTGAGDTTIAAFLTSFMLGKSMEECVKLGASEGASCVEAYGALDGIKKLDELKEKIDAGWEKNSF